MWWSRRGPAKASLSCCKAISDGIPRPSVKLELLIPYNRGDLISKLHDADAEIVTP